ncbi:putative prohead protease [Serratia phage vB_SmaS_Opt-169]|nr:putative prohead protease [Serratia phage vB_SmaS_Opt-169]UGO51945.1 putative prohead protease [Serratia phage vB_SmaS_PhooPhighters]
MRISKMQKPKNNEIEKRSISGRVSLSETRDGEGAAVDSNPVISGYAAVYEQPSSDLWWIETIRRGAFDNADFSQCFSFWNHNEDVILGSVRGGSLQVKVDEKGLFYEVKPDAKNSYIDGVALSPMRRGDVTHSSFRFIEVPGTSEWRWDEESDIVYRTITQIARVLDVSPVVFPAYDAADSSLRKAEELRSGANNSKMAEIAIEDLKREDFIRSII